MVPPPRSEATAPRRVLAEDSFAEALQVQGGELLARAGAIRGEPDGPWPERVLYALFRSATDLETFLDDHGARRNATFCRLREAVARVRWTALAASALVHLENRLPSYPPAEPEWVSRRLAPAVQETVRRVGRLLARTTESLFQQWDACGARVQVGEALQEELQGREALQGFMERYCTERIARTFEARAHNLQSEFDSTISGGPEIQAHPDLAVLRGAVSQCLHLLEAVTSLTHLYERHFVYERDPATRKDFEGIVGLDEVLDIIANSCAKMAYESLNRARPVAEGLLRDLLRPTVREFTLPQGVQLHARPVSLVVAVVGHHGTPVQMEIGGETANAASIMSLLVLAGSHPDARSVKFRGSQEVLDDLAALFDSGLGEKGLESLPDHLREILNR